MFEKPPQICRQTNEGDGLDRVGEPAHKETGIPEGIPIQPVITEGESWLYLSPKMTDISKFRT